MKQNIVRKVSLALCALLASITLAGCSIPSIPFVTSPALGPPRLINTITKELETVDSIHITYGSEHMTFYAGDNGQLRIEEYLNADDPLYYAKVEQGGGTLTVERGSRPNTFDGYIDIYLPLDYSGALTVQNNSGGIEIEQPYQLTRLDATTSSGSLRIASLTQLTSLNASANSGSMRVREVDAVAFAASTTSGSLKIEDINAGAFSAKCNSGSLSLDKVDVGDRLDATTSSGGMQLTDITAQSIFAETNSGGISGQSLTSALFSVTTSSGGQNLKRLVGAGTFQSSSGAQRLQFDQLTGSLQSEARSGSIRLEIPKELSFTLRAESNSGTISADFPLEYDNEKRRAASATVGSDPQLHLTLNTSSGGVGIKYN